jgi:hypothetical protein
MTKTAQEILKKYAPEILAFRHTAHAVFAAMEEYASQPPSYTSDQIRQAGIDGELNPIDVDHLISVLEKRDCVANDNATSGDCCDAPLNCNNSI